MLEDSGGYPGEERQADLVSARDIFVRAGPNLRVTHDGAKSWQTVKSSLNFGPATVDRAVLQIDFVDATHGWAVISDNFSQSPDGTYCLYRTLDGGATWTNLPVKIE